MKDPEYSRPIGDDRLWLKNRLGSAYKGEEPEQYSPKDREQEAVYLRDVLFGVRFPRTKHERFWLQYMGGPQEEPPPKRIQCKKCLAHFVAGGWPSPGGGEPYYPAACQICVDEESALSGHRWMPPKKIVRSPHND